LRLFRVIQGFLGADGRPYWKLGDGEIIGLRMGVKVLGNSSAIAFESVD